MTIAVASLAPDVELLGPYRDSGLQNPPYLVRRAGRMVQISRLLHVVAAGADGARTFDEVAAAASVELDRPLTGDDVRYLVRNKLAPAGILITGGEAASQPSAAAPPADKRLLGLRFRRSVAGPHVVDAGARLVGPLFRPVVVTGVLAGVVGLDIWLFGAHGVGGAIDQVVRTPALTFLVLAFVAVSGVFHELGHAAGCRFSGGRPGVAGVGLYLCWPVLYTNVTDAYRLDRRGRLRTDLGGIYFNAIFTLVMGGAYAATGYEPLLAVVVFEHLVVLHQLIPFVRLDGYYIVSDLTGVPDILSRVRPALASLIPGRPTHPDVLALRPGARRILFAYLGSLAIFLAVVLVPALLRIPGMLATSWDSIGPHLHAIPLRAGQWDTPMVVIEALQVAVLALPVVGLALTLAYLGTRLTRSATHRALRACPARRTRPAVPVRQWLDSSRLAIVEGGQVPGGGAVDYFGFGAGGELVLFGTAIDRPARDAASQLLAAARALGSYSSDKLDPGDVHLVVVVSRRRRLAAVPVPT
jgi:putative peptide zinc metalloprotease protein